MNSLMKINSTDLIYVELLDLVHVSCIELDPLVYMNKNENLIIKNLEQTNEKFDFLGCYKMQKIHLTREKDIQNHIKH